MATSMNSWMNCWIQKVMENTMSKKCKMDMREEYERGVPGGDDRGEAGGDGSDDRGE